MNESGLHYSVAVFCAAVWQVAANRVRLGHVGVLVSDVVLLLMLLLLLTMPLLLHYLGLSHTGNP